MARLPFRRSAALLALSLGLLAAHAAPEAQFQPAFELFMRASSGDKGAVEPAAESFDALLKSEPANPVLMAYSGATTAMKAQVSMLPWKKMGHAEDGLALIDKALALLTPAHDAIGQHRTPASLETRFVAANTFLLVPDFMHRGARGSALLAEVLASPLFAQAPQGFQSACGCGPGPRPRRRSACPRHASSSSRWCSTAARRPSRHGWPCKACRREPRRRDARRAQDLPPRPARDPGAAGRGPGGRARRAARADRPFGQRQEHDPEPVRPDRQRRCRRDLHRRPGGDGAGRDAAHAVAPRCAGLRVPGLQPGAGDDGGRERRLPAVPGRGAGRGAPRARGRAARGRRPAGPCGAPARCLVGRPAAARGDCACAGQAPQARDRRRADREPRLAHRRPGAAADARTRPCRGCGLRDRGRTMRGSRSGATACWLCAMGGSNDVAQVRVAERAAQPAAFAGHRRGRRAGHRGHPAGRRLRAVDLPRAGPGGGAQHRPLGRRPRRPVREGRGHAAAARPGRRRHAAQHAAGRPRGGATRCRGWSSAGSSAMARNPP